MNPKKLAFIIPVLITSQSCQKMNKPEISSTVKQEEITSVKLSQYGGMLGFNQTIFITKDSITRETSMTAQNDSVKKEKLANTPANWEALNSSLNLNDFRKIKNGNSNLPVDGTDQKIVINTKTTSDSIINGQNDAINYPKIKKFTDQLNKIRTENFEN